MKTDDTVLRPVYARIDIIDYANAKFSRSASAYLLGDHSKLTKTPSDIAQTNKELVSAIGRSTVRELVMEQAAVSGGGEWEELDDLDVEELLNTETTMTSTASIVSRYTKLTNDIISDIAVFEKDKLDDIKEKIAVATGIVPYKQYLWVPAFNKSMDGSDINLFKHYEGSYRSVEGFPIDSYVRGMAEWRDESISRYTINGALIVYCISIDALIGDKSKLAMLLNSDSETFDMIYNTAIGPFFSALSIGAFVQYITDELSMIDQFPEYAFDKSRVSEKLSTQKKLLAYISDTPRVSIDSGDTVAASMMSILLHSPKKSAQVDIDTISMFKSLSISAEPHIVAVDLYHVDTNKRNVRLRKIQQFDEYRERLTLPNMVFPLPKTDLLFDQCLMVHFMPTSVYSELIIAVSQNCAVWIKAVPNATMTMTKVAFIETIMPVINAAIRLLNAQEAAFTTLSKIPLLSADVYTILSSSSRLVFKFFISYANLIALLVDKLLDAGFIELVRSDAPPRSRLGATFMLKYGVDRSNQSKKSHITIKNLSGMALIELANLDVDETNLYVDILGRLISKNKNTLKLQAKTNSNLAMADPVLFNYQGSKSNYGRLCQKPFQPTIASKSDKGAVEYYNFTFNRPEYYKCPNKNVPALGFLRGKHASGYCMPCCRKLEQPDVENIKAKCISGDDDDAAKYSSYKIDYPIHGIDNHKIMNRRIQMPDHIIRLFGGTPLVANGSIMFAHEDARNGISSDAKSYLQSAIIIAAIDNGEGLSTYPSMREFVLSMVEFIKHPQSHIGIMQQSTVSREFTTPSEVVEAIQDRFLKQTILKRTQLHISDMEWNDIVIYIANRMKLNVLMLSDDRLSDIKIDNFADIDTERPITILLKRLNVEWSSMTQNTRCLYLPLTNPGYRVFAKQSLIIERFDMAAPLRKIKNVYFRDRETILSKQFTAANVEAFAMASKQYKLLDVMRDQKLIIVGIGSRRMVSTISTSAPTLERKEMDAEPTATLQDVMTFIQAYNAALVAAVSKDELDGYREYIKMISKTSNKYELLDMQQFALKAHRLIRVGDHVIGAIVNVVDRSRVIATELMFIKPTTLGQAMKEVVNVCKNRDAMRASANMRLMLAFPMDQCVDAKDVVIEWSIHPLRIPTRQSCKTDMTKSFNTGVYLNSIYQMTVIDVINEWRQAKPTELVEYLVAFIKESKTVPIAETRIDTLVNDMNKHLPYYDQDITRPYITDLFRDINSLDRTAAAASHRISKTDLLNGIELTSLHRWPAQRIQDRVAKIAKQVCIEVDAYPTFDLGASVIDQKRLFYTNGKLRIHKSIYQSVIQMIAADLSNPFRRDYVLNMQHTLSTTEDIHPHIGEVVYVKQLNQL